MAALAIPIVVLGSLYIISEQEKKKNEENIDEQRKLDNTNFYLQNKETYANYNNTEPKITSFSDGDKASDNMLLKPNNIFNDNTKNNNYNSNAYNNIKLMSGEQVDSNLFKHNNMQPYFGAKIRGNYNDHDSSEAILDSKLGNSSQNRSKSEQAPLFSPNENMTYQYGMPNNSDFIQSRMNESMKISNVLPFEQQQVAPGLGLGAGKQDSNGLNVGGVNGQGGFNNGMLDRESWMPKNVDDLRVDNNPKQEFDLIGHEGPLQNIIKSQGTIGKMEQHGPNKTFENGPTRWFTTTGQEKNPPIRSTQVMPMENRIDTTREYFGNGNNGGQSKATYTDTNFEESKKLNLPSLPISNASATGQNLPHPGDFGAESWNYLPNNRTTDGDKTEFGGVWGAARAAIAPIMDIINPTRKETTIDNLRQNGNVNSGHYTGHLYNEYDKTKVTNREITTGKIDMNYVNINRQPNNGTAYQVTGCQLPGNQRDTTNKEYIGISGTNSGGIRPYNAEYAQQNNVNKTYESRPNQGSMSLFNNYNNMAIARNENMLENNRNQIYNGGPSIIPSSEFMGEVNGIQTYDQSINDNRMDPSLLSAFKNNPYTKSLNSVA